MIVSNLLINIILIITFARSAAPHIAMQVTQDDIDNMLADPDQEATNMCSICLVKLVKNRSDKRELIKCPQSNKHLFHSECGFGVYLLDNPRCPLCNQVWTGAFPVFFANFVDNSFIDIRKRRVLLDENKLTREQFIDLLIKANYQNQRRGLNARNYYQTNVVDVLNGLGVAETEEEREIREAEEKAEREEEERIAKEKAEREEEERIAKEKAEREEEERIAREAEEMKASKDKNSRINWVIIIIGVISIAACIFIFVNKRQ